MSVENEEKIEVSESTEGSGDESIQSEIRSDDAPLPDEIAQEAKAESADASKKEPVKATGVAVAAKTIYTPEEVADLLKSGSEVDTSRLSHEGQLLMKSFQRGYDEKFKKLAEERKSTESQRVPEETPRAKLFRRYVNDAVAVTGEINAEIEKLEVVEPGDPTYQNARRMIAQLHAMKDEFREQKSSIGEGQRFKESIYVRADAEVHKAIPDWDVKESKLTKFAQDMGLELDDIKILSDPTIMGMRSVRIIKALNALFDKINAGNSAERKVDKKAPNPLGRAASSGSTEGGGEKSLEQMSYEEYKAHRMKEFNKI